MSYFVKGGGEPGELKAKRGFWDDNRPRNYIGSPRF